MWEAQFGDFANGAQCIIDQFVCSGEQKWLERTGLTMLLPHGYDGQGPEHSSARIERFLQLVDEDPYLMPSLNSTEKGSYARQHQDCNMQVLIAFVSKSLLRHPLARSSMSEMEQGTRFQRLIPEILHPNPLKDLELSVSDGTLWADNNKEPRIPHALSENAQFSLLPPTEITTLIFCSGQVYYTLYKTRELNKLNHVAIVRVEQLSPFPFWECKQVVDFYGSSLKEIVWAQEESLNSGSWLHVEPRLTTAVKNSDWYKTPL
ncbi:2-oxoglutarate dehydrogenase E1 component, partial [Nowakowskiella sp. JEL0078]